MVTDLTQSVISVVRSRCPTCYNAMMTKPFQAVYESGVLKPLEPLSLAEHEVVTLIVAGGGDSSPPDEVLGEMEDRDMLAIAEREGQGAIPLEELRERLKSIRGSMSDVIISERGEY